MPNPEKGEFALAFGATSLTFKMGTAALIEAQEQIGRETGYVPTLEEMIRDVMRQRLAYLRAFLWAGLRKYHPEQTIEDVTGLLDEMDPEQAQTLLQGLTGSMTPAKADVAALQPIGGGARPRKARAPKGRATGDAVSTSPRVPAA